MWESLRNLGNKIKDGFNSICNKFKPTSDAAKAFFSNLWTTVKESGSSLGYSYAAGESFIKMIGHFNRALFNTGKGLAWDLPRTGFALTENLEASKKVFAEVTNDFSEAKKQAKEAYNNGSELIDNSGKAIIHAHHAGKYTGLTAYHAGETIYQAGILAHEGISFGAGIAKNGAYTIYYSLNDASYYLPSFNFKRDKREPILMLQAPPGIELQKQSEQLPNSFKIAAATIV